MTLTTKLAPCMAEVLFLDPNDVNQGIAALAQHGFEVKILDWIDPYGPTIWVHAFINTNDEAGLLVGCRTSSGALAEMWSKPVSQIQCL
jgi:hypothetical protein